MLKEILVIDDNPDIRFLICNILNEQNFNVRSAANYDQAVLEINQKLPDLAIVDIKLDKIDKESSLTSTTYVLSYKKYNAMNTFDPYDMEGDQNPSHCCTIF